jgi:hypothetical protein
LDSDLYFANLEYKKAVLRMGADFSREFADAYVDGRDDNHHSEKRPAAGIRDMRLNSI